MDYKKFNDYLEVVEGISPEYFDNNYDGVMADEVYDRYNAYDGENWEQLVKDFEKRGAEL